MAHSGAPEEGGQYSGHKRALGPWTSLRCRVTGWVGRDGAVSSWWVGMFLGRSRLWVWAVLRWAGALRQCDPFPLTSYGGAQDGNGANES